MSDTIDDARTDTRAPPGDLAALVARLRAHAHELREQGVVSLVIFGSRARGDARHDSDLDVLITYDPARPFTLYDLVRVERLLERITRLGAHVSTRDGFPPGHLSRLLKDAVSVL
jgi:predicted nucleotidyltransferase